jgi:hypothetical protein
MSIMPMWLMGVAMGVVILVVGVVLAVYAMRKGKRSR